MNKPSKSGMPPNKPKLLTTFVRNYSGPITGVALSVLSAWMIVTGLKDAAGFEVTRQSALADLAGIALIVGVARWLRFKFDVK